MIIRKLSSNQIITLNDFPVYNEQILKIFFKIYQKGCCRIVPPCPVIHKKQVVPFFSKELSKEFKKFENKNKSVEYFLLDGSHKTTAAALTNNKTNVILIEKKSDIIEAKKLVKKGKLFSLTIEKTIKENIQDLIKHFNKKKEFQTVEEKTQKMIKEKVIPGYMIKYYRNKVEKRRK